MWWARIRTVPSFSHCYPCILPLHLLHHIFLLAFTLLIIYCHTLLLNNFTMAINILVFCIEKLQVQHACEYCLLSSVTTHEFTYFSSSSSYYLPPPAPPFPPFIRSHVVDSLATPHLLLQLDGEEAVTALYTTIMECVLCVSLLTRRGWRMGR